MKIKQFDYFTRYNGCVGCVHDLDDLQPRLIFNT